MRRRGLSNTSAPKPARAPIARASASALRAVSGGVMETIFFSRRIPHTQWR